MPAPLKDKAQRVYRATPVLGEWRDLPPLDKTYLPDLPADEWPDRTIAWWKGLQADPVTQIFGPSELAQAIEMAYLHRSAIDKDGARMSAEWRQWMNLLGFTPKGKRDLRLRVSEQKAAGPSGVVVAMPSRRDR
jgi:hypothetical protein